MGCVYVPRIVLFPLLGGPRMNPPLQRDPSMHPSKPPEPEPEPKARRCGWHGDIRAGRSDVPLPDENQVLWALFDFKKKGAHPYWAWVPWLFMFLLQVFANLLSWCMGSCHVLLCCYPRARTGCIGKQWSD